MFPSSSLRLAACASLAFLAACSSAPPATISLPPGATAQSAPQPGAASSIGEVRTQRIEWKGSKPGCEGECPTIEIDSVAFPDIPRLSLAVDETLASLTGIDSKLRGQYNNLSEFTQYFWRTAQGRDATVFKASVKNVGQGVVSVELHTGQYFTGAAHGIPATVFLNWQLAGGHLLQLDDLLIPGRRAQYVEALRQAHQQWLASNEDAKRDPVAYNRIWPFQSTDNVAFSRDGLVAKYDAYSIAPYSQGEPELLLPWSALQGIIKPEYLGKP
ncbi:RsiV family protein [Bordetella avium]|uniref:RsiV family protein n=1 Tax=Bordetella avium TaxID=521 RepID=UPI000E0A29E0|nr:RsiV family protein [Bordetella avium]RIQ12340.1 DUF3298 domain-containing protein [Bordetella avium]RIQ36059.1 DUF3298 domain-containing protein [Bordetella avium]RIQ40113.1 DUF3298 domain-containing protein [Bordetella avium]RIQ41724.1 DUF3298 domain-containing protein [Bordetella avium]RIQ47430.1 DUF3298 domain-containing protein [Bordetella avium]